MNEWEWQLLEDKQLVEYVDVNGARLAAGSRVRLQPRAGGDVLDIALGGQAATVEAIEQDYEGNMHICVVLDEDPGRDMGMLRQPGHRFFFDPSEVHPISDDQAAPRVGRPTILVAGIGNIFLGDDAFGAEVARRLALRGLPASVRITDFGIRGFDLACALQDEYSAVILVDAMQRGGHPGTVYVIEPDLALAGSAADSVNAHGLDPVRVLCLASSMGARLKRILLVACEPQEFGGEHGDFALSPSVETAVEQAITKIEALVEQILQGKWPGSE